MALSCVFCAADHEARSAHDATMETYRAPQGALGKVQEGTSSQERGSNSSLRRDSSEGGTGDRTGRQLSMEEARRRSEDSIRRNSDEMHRRQESPPKLQPRSVLPKCLEPMPPQVIEIQGQPLRSRATSLSTVPDVPEPADKSYEADPLVLICQR